MAEQNYKYITYSGEKLYSFPGYNLTTKELKYRLDQMKINYSKGTKNEKTYLSQLYDDSLKSEENIDKIYDILLEDHKKILDKKEISKGGKMQNNEKVEYLNNKSMKEPIINSNGNIKQNETFYIGEPLKINKLNNKDMNNNQGNLNHNNLATHPKENQNIHNSINIPINKQNNIRNAQNESLDGNRRGSLVDNMEEEDDYYTNNIPINKSRGCCGTICYILKLFFYFILIMLVVSIFFGPNNNNIDEANSYNYNPLIVLFVALFGFSAGMQILVFCLPIIIFCCFFIIPIIICCKCGKKCGFSMLCKTIFEDIKKELGKMKEKEMSQNQIVYIFSRRYGIDQETFKRKHLVELYNLQEKNSDLITIIIPKQGSPIWKLERK